MRFHAAQLLVLATVALVVGVIGGVAIAQQAPWNRPGDEVQTLEDADRAIEWWRGGSPATATQAPAADGDLWLAFGQIADDMMELDERTRSPLYRRAESMVMTGDLVVQGLRIFCDPGDYAVSGGWAIDPPFVGGDVNQDVIISGSFPAPVALGPVHAWDVNFLQTEPPLEGPVRVSGYAICWDLAG